MESPALTVLRWMSKNINVDGVSWETRNDIDHGTVTVSLQMNNDGVVVLIQRHVFTYRDIRSSEQWQRSILDSLVLMGDESAEQVESN